MLHHPGASNDHDDSERLTFVLRRSIDEPVAFLEWSQDRVAPDSMARYVCLGQGEYVVTEQRLDVTGHALSALANLLLPAWPRPRGNHS